MIWFIFLISAFGFFGVYEYICIRHGWPTLSEKIWLWFRVRPQDSGPWPWPRSVLAAGFGLLSVWLYAHFVFHRTFIWF